jgi:hypothetical protein
VTALSSIRRIVARNSRSLEVQRVTESPAALRRPPTLLHQRFNLGDFRGGALLMRLSPSGPKRWWRVLKNAKAFHFTNASVKHPNLPN